MSSISTTRPQNVAATVMRDWLCFPSKGNHFAQRLCFLWKDVSTCREYGLSMISCLHHLSQLHSKIFIKLVNKISYLSTCLFASLGWNVTCTCDSFKKQKANQLYFCSSFWVHKNFFLFNKKDLTIIIFMIHMKAM